jgi:UDP-2,3-diacylglucosamine pyrophosphatase LpxH
MVAHCIRKGFTSEQAEAVADMLGVDLAGEGIELEAFRRGMVVELEHGSRDPRTNVTDDDPILTGKIALAHLRELPDYYDRLEVMEHGDELRILDEDTRTSHQWLSFEHQFRRP